MRNFPFRCRPKNWEQRRPYLFPTGCSFVWQSSDSACQWTSRDRTGLGWLRTSIHFNYVSEFNEIWRDSDMGAGTEYFPHFPSKDKPGCVIDVAALPNLKDR